MWNLEYTELARKDFNSLDGSVKPISKGSSESASSSSGRLWKASRQQRRYKSDKSF